MNKIVTIKDIASALKIHHSTVSRALHNHPDVSEETKERVMKMAKELNYSPNIFARSLKTNSVNVIGVIVPEIKHFFFANIIDGIEEVAHREGFALLLSQSNENYEREVINTNALIANRVAGLLVSISQTTKDSKHFENIKKQGIHLVFFDRIMPEFDASKVVVSDYKGAFIATEHLISKGYRHIAHIGGRKDFVITKNRFKGYLDALEKNNIPFDKDLVYFSGFQETNGIEGMKYLFDSVKRIDAVFAVNDPVALGAYGVIKKRGLKIPQDIAVVGFSDNPIAKIVEPSLTTIKQPAYEMGKQAAELLFKQIKEKSYKSEEIVLNTELIERNSA